MTISLKWRMVFFLTLFIAIVVAFAYFVRKDREESYRSADQVFMNGQYAIGTITGKEYSGSKGLNTVVSINFNFTVKSDTITSYLGVGMIDYYNISSKLYYSVDEGQKYLVIYDKNKPKDDALFFLEKPINDSLDFYRSVSEIEILRMKKQH